jgi:hypothetical protein
MTGDRVELSWDEWHQQFREFDHSAFRLELQTEYWVEHERAEVERFLAGDLTPRLQPETSDWYQLIQRHRREGKSFGRIRVHDEPLTGYQQWLRWVSRWNVQAGEDQRYLTRAKAHEIGLLPAAGDVDWWLFDENRLVEMRFDTEHRMVSRWLTSDPDRIRQALAWRDLALPHAVPLVYPQAVDQKDDQEAQAS